MPEINDELHYPIIAYTFTKPLCIGNLIGLLPYSYFSYFYCKSGTTYTLTVCGLGDIPVVSTITGIGSALSEFVAAATQFSISGGAKQLDQWLYETLNPPGGLLSSATDSFCQTVSSPSEAGKTLFRGISYAMFAVSSAAGTYAFIEPIKEPLIAYLGNIIAFPIMGFLGASGMLAYALGYGSKCKNSVESWLKDGFTIQKRYHEHQQVSIEAQVLFEQAITVIARVASVTFPLVRCAEQWDWSPDLARWIGVTAGIFQGIQVFCPATHKKYHFSDDDPTHQEEREAAYTERYQNMSYVERGFVEIKRGFLIGYTQTALTGGYLAWQFGGPLLAAVTAPLCYYVFYNASLYKELNEIAAEKRVQEEKTAPASYATFDEPDDEPEPEPRPSYCAAITATFFSLVQQVTRGFSLIAYNKLTRGLSGESQVVLGAQEAAIVGSNRHDTFLPQMKKTFAELGCQERVSNQGLFQKRTTRSQSPEEIPLQVVISPRS